MKKFLLSLAVLSMSALLLTACNKADDMEVTTPSGEEEVMEPADEAMMEEGEEMMSGEEASATEEEAE